MILKYPLKMVFYNEVMTIYGSLLIKVIPILSDIVTNSPILLIDIIFSIYISGNQMYIILS